MLCDVICTGMLREREPTLDVHLRRCNEWVVEKIVIPTSNKLSFYVYQPPTHYSIMHWCVHVNDICVLCLHIKIVRTNLLAY